MKQTAKSSLKSCPLRSKSRPIIKIIKHLCGIKSCTARSPFQSVQRFICRQAANHTEMHECGHDIWGWLWLSQSRDNHGYLKIMTLIVYGMVPLFCPMFHPFFVCFHAQEHLFPIWTCRRSSNVTTHETTPTVNTRTPATNVKLMREANTLMPRLFWTNDNMKNLGIITPLYDWVMLANGKRFNFSWSLMVVYGLWVNWSPCESSKVWICFVPRLTGFIEVGMLKARLVLCCGGLLVVIFPDIHWLQWLIRRQGLW